MTDLSGFIDEIVAEAAIATDRGKVADYIPSLGCIDPGHFGIAIVTPDGSVHTGGDADVPFSIQSVSKVFALTLALGKVGGDLWQRVGVEPSGSAFNSVVQLEAEKGIPRNPFINAGAIVVSDVVLGSGEPRDAIGDILRFVRFVSGDDSVLIDSAVANSEADTGFRNVALANYMRAFGNMAHRVDDALKVYFHQCAIAMSCRQLAMAGRYLMMDGVNPDTGRAVVTPVRARRILSLMLTRRHSRQVGRRRRHLGGCAGQGEHRSVVAGAERARQFEARQRGARTPRCGHKLERVYGVGSASAGLCRRRCRMPHQMPPPRIAQGPIAPSK
jgi:glutaminase